MKKKISNVLRKPFKAGSSSSSTAPLCDILQGITNGLPDFDLISLCIEEALREIPAESKDQFQSDSRLAFMLDAGSKVLNNLEDTADKIKKQASPDGLSLIVKMLEGTGNTHYVGLCFSVVAVALNSYRISSNNRTECRKLLQTAIKLIGHLKELSSSRSFFIRNEKELNNAVSWLLYTAIRIISMAHRSRASRFLYALIDKKDLDTIYREVHETFPELSLSTTITLLNHVEEERYYKPEYKKTSNIVGMDSQIEEVMKDLHLKQDRGGCTCVCIHAMGGAGKSTLAKSVYSIAKDSKLKGYYYCQVELDLHENDATLVEKQKEILEKLLESKLPQKIGNKEDGKWLMKDEIQKLKKPVFIVLDNLNLSLDQVHFVVPSINVFKPGSAILVTTRYKRIGHSLQRLGFNPLMKEIPSLKDEEARMLLYQSMGCDPQKDVDERVRKKCERELLQACCGLPLALKVVGGVISKNDGLNKEQVWEDVLESLREGRSISGDAEEKDTLLLCLKFSIDALSSKLRDSFFDIIAFLNNQSWWYVAYAVGNEAMEDLKARHLIQEQKSEITWDDYRFTNNINEITSSLTTTRVKVHDVVHGLGMRMMEEKGEVVIRSPHEFQYLDSMKPRNIRGICLTPIEQKEASSITWSQLCVMENIRVLSDVVVEGHQFIKPLKSLRVLSLRGHASMLPFALDNAPNLKILEGESIDMQQMKLPKGVKYLWLQKKCPSLSSFGNCQLEYLVLKNCDKLVKLEGIQHLHSLKHLQINRCKKLREVEDLPALQSLHIEFCDNIEHIISCNFSALRAFKLLCCRGLKEIPFDIENIHYFTIQSCERLHIPDVLNFRHVAYFFIKHKNVKQLPLPQLHWTHQQSPYVSLRHMSLIRSEHLKELPEVFFCSSLNLETLDLSYCKNLISLPKNNRRGVNFQLKVLRLQGCTSLEALDVSDLSCLQELDVSSSTNLITCSISELQPVQILNFSDCPKLEGLRSMSILSLRYLKKLRLNGCWKVKKEVEDILQCMPPSLEEMDVRGCLNMEEVEECLGDKILDVNVLSEPSSWSKEMSEEEKMQKMSEVLQSLYFMDSMDNIIPGTHLQGILVCLLFLRYDEEVLENANTLNSELENAGKPLRFIYICYQQSIQIPEHGLKVSPYHTSSLLSLSNEMCHSYDSSGMYHTSGMLITTVGNGCGHVLSDAKALWQQFGLEGYPFTRDALANVAKPLTLSSFLRYQTTFTRHNDPHHSPVQVTPDQLTGKLIALYCSWNPIPFFTRLTHAGEQHEFIWITSKTYNHVHEPPEGQLVLKMDLFDEKLWYVYGGLLKHIRISPPVVIVFDKEGNLLCPNAWEACMRYGVANAFPFTPDKIASLPDQPFLNSPLHFLLCNTKLHTATLPATKVSLESLEGTVVCFVIIHTGSQQFLEMVVKDYQNLKGEWKKQVQIICLLDDNFKLQTTHVIPSTWLIADLSCCVERYRFCVKEDKKTQLPKFLRNNNCWCLGFDGEGEMIREGGNTRLFAKYLLEEHQVYNDEDIEGDNRSIAIRNEVGTMSLNSKITEGWEIPSPINHPQHHTCQLYICLRNCICDICEQRKNGWTYYCLSCDFDICLDCIATRKPYDPLVFSSR